MSTVDCFDGNTAAAHVAYAMSDCAVIFPITPSSVMGELADTWSAQGRKNIFDQTLSVTEMQSEAGAAGAVHGCLSAGALTTTFTASQGLLLMIPNMYKIAGERIPAVFHVSARAIASQALSIFGDHQDVMAARATGFSFLCASSVQECMDLALVAHLSALKGSLPFVHFFDGFRTSHEIQKISILSYEQIKSLVDWEDIKRFRAGALNPEHPQMRGTAQQPEIYFQLLEASNNEYAALPEIVQEQMRRVSAVTGRQIHLFDYVGAPDATEVVIIMGAGACAVEEAVEYLNAHGHKVGVLKVRLYRPWSARHFLAALPATATKIAVLDRTKEPGSFGEPLYLDVAATIQNAHQQRTIVGGRFGLGSKDFTATMAKSVFENLFQATPKNHFTVGINDDLSHTSLPVTEEINALPEGTVQCLIWGLGSDGTVGANKEAIKLIGHNTELFSQGYFEYDAKKSGGLTRSHLRFGPRPINATYLVTHADYVACHNPGYVGRYELLKAAKVGAKFLLNSPWTTIEAMEANLPGDLKRVIAQKHIHLYNIDAIAVAARTGNGQHIGMIMQTAFFKLANVIPLEQAIELLKKSVVKMFGKKGQQVVKVNHDAIDLAQAECVGLAYPASWADAALPPRFVLPGAPEFVNETMIPCGRYTSDSLPVSTLGRLCPGGIMPTSTARWEKRGLAPSVPAWDLNGKCVQCAMCSFVCPHAVIRPYLVTDAEAQAAPYKEGFAVKPTKGKEFEGYSFRIQVSVMDCTGCGSCANVCPVKALEMKPYPTQARQHENWMYCQTLPVRDQQIATSAEKPNTKASQFRMPYFEFSGACGGCGETPYLKLVSQLFGDRMIIANATGCSSIYSGSAPWSPYTVNKDGHGPAWANSLFEDNAEYGYGMFLATAQRRKRVADLVQKALAMPELAAPVREALQFWYDHKDQGEESKQASVRVKAALEAHHEDATLAQIWDARDMLTKKSQWIYGGDGWAYDIGFGGLDHVLACGDDVNVVVMDTEVYSNTGGQRSKSTNRGAVAQFAASGKKTAKKDLGSIFMSYGNIYVASCAIGSNPGQFLKAVHEAESYNGPSILICYSPCINHSIKGGMANSIEEEKLAVKFGYWYLYRYDPRLAAQGKNPFQLDSKEPAGDLKEFLYREVRYESLTRSFPQEAERLHALLAEDKRRDYIKYRQMATNWEAPQQAQATAAPAAAAPAPAAH
uniref:pyruvate dehydrogenase (NADP(+)) n=1 Tax=Paratrimastix pyriformis TaxID=342808 RepID=B0F472_9EUKA|nr:pyruvate:ferredoxin oxidoreductase [Paratrimastix pyriformis]